MSKVSKNTQPVATHGATGYQGKVKIAVFKGKKQIKQQTAKNNGTNKLFAFLCLCVGAQYDRQAGPVGIQLKKDANTAITNTISISRVLMDTNGSAPQTTFSFVVPFSAILQNEPQTLAILSLVNGNNESLAEVTLKEDSQITMSKAQADYSLNIDWIMSFSNVAITE